MYYIYVYIYTHIYSGLDSTKFKPHILDIPMEGDDARRGEDFTLVVLCIHIHIKYPANAKHDLPPL